MDGDLPRMGNTGTWGLWYDAAVVRLGDGGESVSERADTGRQRTRLSPVLLLLPGERARAWDRVLITLGKVRLTTTRLCRHPLRGQPASQPAVVQYSAVQYRVICMPHPLPLAILHCSRVAWRSALGIQGSPSKHKRSIGWPSRAACALCSIDNQSSRAGGG